MIDWKRLDYGSSLVARRLPLQATRPFIVRSTIRGRVARLEGFALNHLANGF
jgi:hypothetical protein